MPKDADATRTRLLEAAHALVLAEGFAATSVDRVIKAAGVTKGAFFHHFVSKAALAHALVERYAERDLELLASTMARCERLTRDPVQQVLLFVGFMLEAVEEVARPGSGCLFASFCYEESQLEEPTKALVRESFLEWRLVLAGKLREAFDQRPPAVPVDPDSLADLLTGVIEGAHVLNRTVGQPSAFREQLEHYRNYLELLLGTRGSA